MTTIQAISPGISRKDVTQDYKKAEGAASDNAASYNNRGLDFMAKGQLDSAIDNFDKTIKLDPASPLPITIAALRTGTNVNTTVPFKTMTRYWYLTLEMSLPITIAALPIRTRVSLTVLLKTTTRHWRLDPYNVSVYSNRGVAFLDKDDLNRAIEDYDKALKLDPCNVPAYNNRGNAYMNRGELDHAIRDYNHALSLDPNIAAIFYNRGITWLQLSEWGKSQSDLSTAKNLEVDIASQFSRDYGNLTDFEEKMNLQVPEDIADLLDPITEEEDAALSQAIMEGLATEPVSKQSVLNFLRGMDEG